MELKYKFLPLSEDEYIEWDSFVNNSLQGTIFHESWWLKQNKNHLIYGCRNDIGQIIAGFVCYEKKEFGLIKSFGKYSPGAYIGNLYKTSSGKYITNLSFYRDLSYSIANTIKSNCMIAKFTMSPYEMNDVMAFIWAGFTTSINYTYILDLHNIDIVWNEMDPDCRNSIRKSIKDGIYIDSNDELEQSLNLAKLTFQRQNKKLDSDSWIEKSPIYHSIAKSLSRCRSFTAKNKEGVAIASVYIMWDNKRGYYVLGGYDNKIPHHGASSLALWNAIEYTKNTLGLNEFDFEGSMLPNIESFFRQFGAKLIPYYNVSWIDHRLKPFFTIKQLLRETYGAILGRS